MFWVPVPKGRQSIARGVSPWTGQDYIPEPQRGDRRVELKSTPRAGGIGYFTELICRRVADEVNGIGDFSRFTPLFYQGFTMNARLGFMVKLTKTIHLRRNGVIVQFREVPDSSLARD